MQFTQFAALFLAFASGINALPSMNATDMEPFHLHARSCGAGLLKGKALKACQAACKVACNVIPNPVGSAACAASCDRKRSVPTEIAAESSGSDSSVSEVEARALLEDRACGLFEGKAKELCQKGCAGVCTAIPNAAAKGACQVACKKRSELTARDPEPAPLTGGQVCRGACAVTCNSTVLALVQKKCLSVCNGKCPK
ncbi:uncharacterized protein PG986_011221 [Apiospora aurea]|uniref:Uncharacterized protein n=1 Tax=Apiospora aurea TaxID=335848 RepID=A0ABR1Q4N3_9PEZI